MQPRTIPSHGTQSSLSARASAFMFLGPHNVECQSPREMSLLWNLMTAMQAVAWDARSTSFLCFQKLIFILFSVSPSHLHFSILLSSCSSPLLYVPAFQFSLSHLPFLLSLAMFLFSLPMGDLQKGECGCLGQVASLVFQSFIHVCYAPDAPS